MAKVNLPTTATKNDGQNIEFLTENGHKFLTKLLPILRRKEKILLSSAAGEKGKNADEAERSSRDHLVLIQQQIMDCERKLQLPKREVREQKILFLPGNGAKVKIEGETHYIVMDGVCVCKHKLPPKHMIVGVNSAIGQALHGKKVGESVSYPINGSGHKTATIESIDLPSKSKWIFKYDNPVAKLEEMAAEVETKAMAI